MKNAMQLKAVVKNIAKDKKIQERNGKITKFIIKKLNIY